MIAYEASPLRFRPDPVSAEFVNVGLLVVGRTENGTISGIHFDFDARCRRRAREFFQNCFDGESFSQWRRDLIKRFEKARKTLLAQPLINPTYAFQEIQFSIYRAHHGVFIWGDVTVGTGENLDLTFAELYEELIIRHITDPVKTALSDEEFWMRNYGTITERLNAQLSSNLVQFEYQVGSKRQEKVHMRWRNGVEQFLEPLSLALKDPDHMKEKTDRLAGRLYYLSKERNFLCTILVAPPEAPEFLSQYKRRVAELRDAPKIRDVIESAELPGFLQKVAAEAKPLV